MRPGVFYILGLTLAAAALRSPIVAVAEDLSFPRALELAAERSEILLLQASAVKRAGLAVAEARSRLGPELTFQAAGGFMAFPPEGVTVRAGELGTIPPPISYAIPEEDLIFIEDARSGYFELSLQLNQPLYTWGKLHSSVQLAGLELETSKVELTEQKRRLRQDLHTAYFSGVLARDSLGPLQQILDILEEIEEDRQRAFELTRGGANLRPDISFYLFLELSRQTVPWSESGREDAWDLKLIAGVGARGTFFDIGRSWNSLQVFPRPPKCLCRSTN